ncbi:isochorismate synthase [Ornithinibacillus bavariensis]|uniref:isochorismate synthase n=1 Tax=Ornithinibacillus bavariensis TaxID=545502 RepID=UPI000EDF9341|nr:isochorismate synthase [Ornithinibacillus sp.]
MIEVKEETLESTLVRVIQGLHSSESRLVSFTKKIQPLNPLHFFEAGLTLHMNRSYWHSTIDDFVMVGIGSAVSIHEDSQAISSLEEKWESVLKEAVINNPYQIPGTGIAAIGGMAFDPHKPKTALWNKFTNNELRVPTFLLLVNQQGTFLTTTILVDGMDDPKLLIRQLADQEKALLSYQNIDHKKPVIVGREEVEPEQWKETVKHATEYIAKGQVEKIVLARELRLTFSEEVGLTDVIKQLIDTQPTSYIFAYEKGTDCFVGASPERLIKLEGNQLLSTCLAGTAPRGRNELEDDKIGYQLLHDEKNLQEHDFVVQMIKNSVEEFCQKMEIPKKPVLYRLRNLQHLYTPVRGIFKEGYSIFDVIEKLHPTPALGGEPRKEALSYIRESELLDRGWYGAPFGWIDSNQNGEFAVAIRSGLIQGNTASLFAGCGVVRSSDPEAEFEETRIKFLPMLTVLGG